LTATLYMNARTTSASVLITECLLELLKGTPKPSLADRKKRTRNGSVPCAKRFALNARRQKRLREVEFIVPFFVNVVVCARQRHINFSSAKMLRGYVFIVTISCT
jgi:hypothetical protein